jgi:hypothetical protein
VPPSVAVSPHCGRPPGAPGQGDPRQRVASRSYRKGFSTTPTPYGCLPVEGTGSWMVAALIDHTKHPARMVVDHRKAHKLKGRSRQVRSLSMKAPLLRGVQGDTYERGRHGFAHTGSTPKEELVSNFPKIFKRSPTPAPRYYIYISQTKVETGATDTGVTPAVPRSGDQSQRCSVCRWRQEASLYTIPRTHG